MLPAGKYADTFEGFLRSHHGQEEVEFHVKKVEGKQGNRCENTALMMPQSKCLTFVETEAFCDELTVSFPHS